MYIVICLYINLKIYQTCNSHWPIMQSKFHNCSILLCEINPFRVGPVCLTGHLVSNHYVVDKHNFKQICSSQFSRNVFHTRLISTTTSALNHDSSRRTGCHANPRVHRRRHDNPGSNHPGAGRVHLPPAVPGADLLLRYILLYK